MRRSLYTDIVTKPVTKPCNETLGVTKPDWDERAIVLNSEFLPYGAVSVSGSRVGRPPVGAVAMSGAERARKYRERRRAAVAAS
jgi:hypothetical protein